MDLAALPDSSSAIGVSHEGWVTVDALQLLSALSRESFLSNIGDSTVHTNSLTSWFGWIRDETVSVSSGFDHSRTHEERDRL